MACRNTFRVPGRGAGVWWVLRRNRGPPGHVPPRWSRCGAAPSARGSGWRWGGPRGGRRDRPRRPAPSGPCPRGRSPETGITCRTASSAGNASRRSAPRPLTSAGVPARTASAPRTLSSISGPRDVDQRRLPGVLAHLAPEPLPRTTAPSPASCPWHCATSSTSSRTRASTRSTRRSCCPHTRPTTRNAASLCEPRRTTGASAEHCRLGLKRPTWTPTPPEQPVRPLRRTTAVPAQAGAVHPPVPRLRHRRHPGLGASR